MLLRPFYTSGTPSSKANYFAIINQSNENRKQRNRENCRSGKNNCVSERDETNKRVCPYDAAQVNSTLLDTIQTTYYNI